MPPLSDDGLLFLRDRHLAILSSLDRPGSPHSSPIHAVAVGFTVHDGVARIITSDGTQKVRNVERGGIATVAQVDGARWISLSGTATVNRDAAAVSRAEQLYSERYRQPGPNPKRVVIEIAIDRILASRGLRA
jgi:PPOX class probable F420-dependent enzyme